MQTRPMQPKPTRQYQSLYLLHPTSSASPLQLLKRSAPNNSHSCQSLPVCNASCQPTSIIPNKPVWAVKKDKSSTLFLTNVYPHILPHTLNSTPNLAHQTHSTTSTRLLCWIRTFPVAHWNNLTSMESIVQTAPPQSSLTSKLWLVSSVPPALPSIQRPKGATLTTRTFVFQTVSQRLKIT